MTSSPLKTSCSSWSSCDTLALGSADLAAAAVERDAEGVPTAWRLLKTGSNPITKEGASFSLDMSAEQLGRIVANQQAKGSKVPVDSRHWLFQLAESKGVSETEALAMIPEGRAAMAFGDLEARTDGLWLSGVEFRPAARKLVAEGIYRHFSPVVRGLADGNLRVTSVALENVPALNNLDSLAASAEDAPIIDFERLFLTQRTQKDQEKENTNMLRKLALTLGHDVIDLTSDGAIPGLLEKAKKVKAAADLGEALFGKIKDALALAADTEPAAVIGHVLGLSAKAKTADTLKAERDALALAAETAKKESIIQSGVAAGKLPNSMLEWAKTQDAVALSAFLAVAPVVVPQGELDRSKLKKEDVAALSAEAEDVLRTVGVDPEELKPKDAKTGK